ncbi:pyrroloquinoline quinone biosynthesis peptide chaperone PqqD [Kribbella sandramycini]|uniref:Pyrroloquinoline quinone biosynthesis peptide chaperone PqqD n=1 Tax=Kribbella sandramycini TaxID=60450 RepID=A0A7Y4KZP2_9ACTN|nr:pyrroloquinoline quinone biosynthesis peptide chaperone PqqD [Kribbella sandramycini]MBB6569273.1 pyrroloquinoline quinone biosynthesis protein D [Kribbella sandramycini]NOL40887.1 pyrroloquinoline quinone biosynthesis peptide chaperone PqqD [Kribbella sandramycini]
MSTPEADPRPVLRRGVRLSYDSVRSAWVVLHPEGVLMPNATATAVLELCDGERSLSEIAKLLGDTYADVRPEQIRALLDRLADKQVIQWS